MLLVCKSPIAIAVILLITTLFPVSSTAQVSPEGAVDRAVLKAKGEGKPSVVMDGPLKYPMVIGSFSDSMKIMSAFRATSLESATVLSDDRNSLHTWYKFSVDEDMSLTPNIPSPVADRGDLSIPASLLPVSENEILIRVSGGQLVVSGILVRYGDSEKIFKPGRKYFLLLLSGGLSKARHLYSLTSQNATSFSIKDDGDTLLPVNPLPGSPIQDEISRRFNHSLSTLRANRGKE